MKKKQIIYIFICLSLLFILIWFLRKDPIIMPPVLAINLLKNTERWTELSNEFRDWHRPIERFDAIKRSPGSHGCALSHIRCLEIAKQRKYPWVLIIEDDCILTQGAKENFQKILPFLWENRNSWDFFSGGSTYITTHKLINRDLKIYQVKGYASQFVLAHYETYGKVIDLFNRQAKIPTIDVFYADNFRIWTSLPYISKQRPNISDISGKDQDYTYVFDKAETLLYQDLRKN
jgi:hypothetical protein